MLDIFGSGYEKIMRTAEISECGRYRWWLRRTWGRGGNGLLVSFIMLNPSTADAFQDDPTLKRCMAMTQSWGYSILSVRNLFPYRATYPKELLTAERPTGGSRGDAELCAATTADLVIAAWGASVPLEREAQALALLKGPLHCLKRTKHGKPQHPLFVRADTQPILFRE